MLKKILDRLSADSIVSEWRPSFLGLSRPLGLKFRMMTPRKERMIPEPVTTGGENTYKHYLWLPQMNSIFSLSTSEFRVYVYDLLTFIASLLALGSSWIRIAWATGKALLVYTSYRINKEQNNTRVERSKKFS